MRLKDKVAIITGGSRGIGKACAIRFASEGAKVVVASRGLEQAENVVQMIRDNGGEAIAISVDISQQENVASMVQQVISEYGKIDVLVNNAGITSDAFFEKMTYEQWHRVIDINLNGTFYCIKEALPYMIENEYGRIINTASIAGERGARTQANYAASKAGIIGLTLTLSQELGSKGITVNAISPGLIETDMVSQIPDKIRERTMKKIPLNRFGTTEEVAGAFAFLASDEGGYCNGMILDINGGICI